MKWPCNIFEFNGKKPRVSQSAYIDPAARILGEVQIGENVAVLYGTIIRGDDDRVVIGDSSAILENCIIEAPKGKPVIVGEKVLISHGAIVHGAKIKDGALIGIGAIVLDGALIGEGAIVGSGAVVPPGKEIPPKTLALGVPAKPVRALRDAEIKIVEQELKSVLYKVKKYEKIIPRPC